MTCYAKHTDFQPPADDNWRCPKCGSGCEHFFVEYPVGDEDCDQLHEDDEVCCTNCAKSWSGADIANIFERQSKGVKSVEEKYREALEAILAIENKTDGGDWDEIEKARAIAKKALEE